MTKKTKRQEFFDNVICADLETTHIDIEKAEVIEIGLVWEKDNQINDIERLYKPIRANYILPEVSAVNHITYKMVVDKPFFEDDVEEIQDIFNGKYMVAHNSDYEEKVFKKYNIVSSYDWICTYKLAKKLYSDDSEILNHKLSYLRYYFELDIPESIAAHRALGDTLVCFKLLEKMIDDMEYSNLLNEEEDYYTQIRDFMNQRQLVEKMPFGKHKGKSIDKLPKDYLTWMIMNLDVLDSKSDHYDPDLAYTVSKAVEKFTW